MNFANWKNNKIKKYFIDSGLRQNVCEECGQLPYWNEKPLVLQLDHIDGNKHNNTESNLRLLCPNCHTQTETFSSRKSRYADYSSISIENLIEYFSAHSSLTGFCKAHNLNYQNEFCKNYLLKLIQLSDAPELTSVKNTFFSYKRNPNLVHGSSFEYQSFVKNKNDLEAIGHIEQLRASRIDFKKFGWVNEAASIIGISPQKVGQWMTRFMPEFYESQCYKRKKYFKSLN